MGTAHSHNLLPTSPAEFVIRSQIIWAKQHFVISRGHYSPFEGREPLSGWQDNNPCAVEQQLAWAHSYGVDFFVFDWYFNATMVDPTEDLNSALKITHTLTPRGHPLPCLERERRAAGGHAKPRLRK
jgi:hypothetical protein